MMRTFLIAAGLVAISAVGVQAADLIVDEAPAAMDTSLVNSSIYVQLLGGVALANDVDYYSPDGSYDGTNQTEAGYALAGTIGVVVMDGFSLEGDVLYTHRSKENDADEFATLSLMANAKYTAALNEMFSLYAAGGLGLVSITNTDGGTDYSGSGLGYQVIIGASAAVTDNISLLLEGRYQNTFDTPELEDSMGEMISVPTTAILAGIKVSM